MDKILGRARFRYPLILGQATGSQNKRQKKRVRKKKREKEREVPFRVVEYREKSESVAWEKKVARDKYRLFNEFAELVLILLSLLSAVYVCVFLNEQSQCQQELDKVLEEISKMTFHDNKGHLENLYELTFPNCDSNGQYNVKQVCHTMNLLLRNILDLAEEFHYFSHESSIMKHLIYSLDYQTNILNKSLCWLHGKHFALHFTFIISFAFATEYSASQNLWS